MKRERTGSLQKKARQCYAASFSRAKVFVVAFYSRQSKLRKKTQALKINDNCASQEFRFPLPSPQAGESASQPHPDPDFGDRAATTAVVVRPGRRCKGHVFSHGPHNLRSPAPSRSSSLIARNVIAAIFACPTPSPLASYRRYHPYPPLSTAFFGCTP